MNTKLQVVKIGGNIIDHNDEFNAFLDDFSAIQTPKILIHGGGKMASFYSQKLGLQTKMVDGRRITSKEDLAVVTMVYAGLINKKTVAYLQSKQGDVVGLSGADMNCIQSVKRPVFSTDFGYVGDVVQVNSSAINGFLKAGVCPVFCAITHDGKGQLLNTNADTITAEIAIAMSPFFETELIYCFEKKGVLRDVDQENSIIPELNQKQYGEMKKNGQIHAGMLPKLKNCFYALQNGVQNVVVGNASILKAADATGTRITFTYP